LKLWG